MTDLIVKENYKKVALVGEGSYGKIYKATHVKNGKTYAIKEIECRSLREANRVKDEPFKLCKVQHENLVKCFGFYLHETKVKTIKVGIIMEFVDSKNLGEELNDRFKTRNYWKEDDLTQIAHRMIATLACMQRHGVAHRDLKPENVFWLPDNQIKVGDMGESKLSVEDEEFATIRGTPRYLSPALAMARQRKEKFVTHNIFKSDVFSLGLILLEMSSLMNITELNNPDKNGPAKTKARLKQLKVMYSQQYLSLIDQLLTYDEATRPDFIDLENQLFFANHNTSTVSFSDIDAHKMITETSTSADLVTTATGRSETSPYKKGMAASTHSHSVLDLHNHSTSGIGNNSTMISMDKSQIMKSKSMDQFKKPTHQIKDDSPKKVQKCGSKACVIF